MSHSELQEIKNRAYVLLEAGRGEEAITLLTRGLSMAPQDDEVLCLMTQAFVEMNKWRDAWRYSERAIAAAPENDWAHRLHSIALGNCARRNEAVAAAKEAVRLNPMLPHNWHTLASSQLNVFNREEARVSAAHLQSLAPSWHMSHQMLSLVALKEGKNKEAENHCRRELELNPNSYYGMNNLGVALLNQKRKREAIDVFTRAAKLNPAAPIARDNIAAAVTKYLPRVSIPFFAVWVILQGFRAISEYGAGGLLILALGFMALLIGGGFLVRWYRYRNLPTEVRAYLSTAKIVTSKKKRITKPQWWFAAMIVCSGIFVAWLVITLIDWEIGGNAPNMIDLFLPLVLVLAFVGTVIAYRRATELHDRER